MVIENKYLIFSLISFGVEIMLFGKEMHLQLVSIWSTCNIQSSNMILY